jgi:hypothetical protein
MSPRLAAGLLALALSLAAAPCGAGSLDAPAILPELATDDGEARWRSEVRLVEAGEEALPALLQLARSDDPRVREAVASVLLGMGEEGALPVNRAVVDALVALIRGEDDAGETAREAFLRLGEAGGRHAISPLIGLLRATDPHTDREIRAMAGKILEGIAKRDLGLDAGTWAEWWGGEERRYLERERVRSLPSLSGEAVEIAPQAERSGAGERVRLVRADLARKAQGPPVPRGGRWLAELEFDIDVKIWPWGLFPARVWFRQGETLVGGRFLPTLDLKEDASSLRSVAVAPASLDPDQPTDVVVQMFDARDKGSFLLVLGGARFREER